MSPSTLCLMVLVWLLAALPWCRSLPAHQCGPWVREWIERSPLLPPPHFSLSSSSTWTLMDRYRHGYFWHSSPARTSLSSLSLTGGGNNGFHNTPTLFTRKQFMFALKFLIVASPMLVEASRLGALFGKLPSGENFVTPPTKWDDVRHATIVFHGAGGQDAYTDELMRRLQSERGGSDTAHSSFCHIVEWSMYSTNLFQASYNGEKIGRSVASYLCEQARNLESIHLVGISVGAFAANAAADEVKNLESNVSSYDKQPKRGTKPYVQLTLLDPFTQRGIFGIGYGNSNFGASSDFAQQYLNTDDPVPSTNSPLQHAVCYDVTALRPDDIFGHDWPLVYYAQSPQVGQLIPPEEQPKPGTVIVL